MHDMTVNSILVTYSANQGKKLNPNEVILKIILKSSLLDDDTYRLKPHVKEMISTLKNYILTP
jgi:hypothetical protein